MIKAIQSRPNVNVEKLTKPIYCHEEGSLKRHLKIEKVAKKVW